MTSEITILNVTRVSGTTSHLVVEANGSVFAELHANIDGAWIVSSKAGLRYTDGKASALSLVKRMSREEFGTDNTLRFEE